MRGKTVDMLETLFITLAFFATLVATIHPYFTWFVLIALALQLYDFTATEDHAIDFAILFLLTLVILPILNILTIITPYTTWLLLIALAIQLYDDHQS
jgi:uncharacterized membrane protein YoaT (DUF817 family)